MKDIGEFHPNLKSQTLFFVGTGESEAEKLSADKKLSSNKKLFAHKKLSANWSADWSADFLANADFSAWKLEDCFLESKAENSAVKAKTSGTLLEEQFVAYNASRAKALDADKSKEPDDEEEWY